MYVHHSKYQHQHQLNNLQVNNNQSKVMHYQEKHCRDKGYTVANQCMQDVRAQAFPTPWGYTDFDVQFVTHLVYNI
jgi:hypothetical protein